MLLSIILFIPIQRYLITWADRFDQFTQYFQMVHDIEQLRMRASHGRLGAGAATYVGLHVHIYVQKTRPDNPDIRSAASVLQIRGRAFADRLAAAQVSCQPVHSPWHGSCATSNQDCMHRIICFNYSYGLVNYANLAVTNSINKDR